MLLPQNALSRAEYEQASAWGLSTSVDLYGCDPDAIRSRESIERFTRELCDLLGVRRFGEPHVVRFGADPQVYGYSMVQLIETSLVSAHFAEDSNAVYLDIFNCKWYDTGAAAEFAKRFSALRTFGCKHACAAEYRAVGVVADGRVRPGLLRQTGRTG